MGPKLIGNNGKQVEETDTKVVIMHIKLIVETKNLISLR